MFNNCRQYNEEGSLIYEDANTLEKVLMDKVKELGPLPDTSKSKSTASTPTRNVGYVSLYKEIRKIFIHFLFSLLFASFSINIQETEKNSTASFAKIKNSIRYN